MNSVNSEGRLETVCWMRCETDSSILVRGLRPGNYVRISVGDIGYVPANTFRRAWFRFENGDADAHESGPVTIRKDGETLIITISPKNGPDRQATIARDVGEEIIERVAWVNALLTTYRGFDTEEAEEASENEDPTVAATVDGTA